MTVRVDAKAKFPHKVDISDESSFLPKNDINSVADWCGRLMGAMEETWSLQWDDNKGWVWGFSHRQDASLFNFVWG
jgi:hypothetical protein